MRYLRLAFLAHDIIEAIVDGRQLPGLSIRNAHQQQEFSIRLEGRLRGGEGGIDSDRLEAILTPAGHASASKTLSRFVEPAGGFVHTPCTATK